MLSRRQRGDRIWSNQLRARPKLMFRAVGWPDVSMQAALSFQHF